MAIYVNFNTVAEMFKNICYAFEGEQREFLFNKVEGKFKGKTYEQVWNEVETFACGLASLGIKRGDKIAIISENRPEWLVADMAILGMGAVDVPLYPILTSDSILFSLNNSESKGIIVSNKFHLNKVLKVKKKLKYLKFIIVLNDVDTENEPDVFLYNQIQKEAVAVREKNKSFFTDNIALTKEDDLATIIYTSGTTGEPKGVLLTHKNLSTNVKASSEIYPVTDKDTFLCFLPLCHVFERTTGYYTAFSGGCKIYYAESIEKVASNMIEAKPTIMTVVPRFVERLYSRIKRGIESQSESKRKLFDWAVSIGSEMLKYSRTNDKPPINLTLKAKLADKLVFAKIREKTGGQLKFFVSGGAALSREFAEFFGALGLVICEGYGMTESAPVISANRVHNNKFGTVGQPMPGVEVKIAHDGEILVHGPNVMQGYYKNRKETDEVLKNDWLHTGDIGVFDAEGFLIITDRKKHLFKTSGGKYVAPTPIENMFLASKYIDQFVLIGDRRMFLTALIVPDFEALKEYADANRIHYESEKDLINLKQIDELLQRDFNQFQKKLANFERIRKFTLLEKPFTIENGELTPSLKVKRKVVEERYGNLIDDMYKALGEKA